MLIHIALYEYSLLRLCTTDCRFMPRWGQVVITYIMNKACKDDFYLDKKRYQ